MLTAILLVSALLGPIEPSTPIDLRHGQALHAFEHLGNIGEQVEAAAASGATVIYATGCGGVGYGGLPPAEQWAQQKTCAAAYAAKAHALGIPTVLGYLCATSIVKLDTFDDHWPGDLRAELQTPVTAWLQQGRDGKALKSWYGGDYEPACMNNPGWRTYQRYMVRQQLETGHDGIFFDNPTVHLDGCFCTHCMTEFSAFLREENVVETVQSLSSREELETIRALAGAHPKEFMRFRSKIASAFFAHIREYARSLNPNAVITANNSLNNPSVFFSQSRTLGYNIQEMSKVEDFVVVEDMGTQPRVENGKIIEYGPTYKLLHAIINDKPLVAVTIAGTDYHTPANLTRLAMAEAIANNSSYLAWTTWPEEHRASMSAAVRDQMEFYRAHLALLKDAMPRREVQLYLPFMQWLDTETCTTSQVADALVKANIQFTVFAEEDFTLDRLDPNAVLLFEPGKGITPEAAGVMDAFTNRGGKVVKATGEDWLNQVLAQLDPPAVTIDGPVTVRAYVWDQPGRTIVHLLNLNIEKETSFEDTVHAAENLRVTARGLGALPRSARWLTADESAEAELMLQLNPEARGASVVIPKLHTSGWLILE